MTIQILKGQKMMKGKLVKIRKNKSLYGAKTLITVDFYTKTIGRHSPLGLHGSKDEILTMLKSLTNLVESA